nr:MAG TPA: Minor capsid protein [Caudoviricetes sp.]
MANRRSRVTLFRRSVQQLTEAQTAALEKTVEALHTEVQQAQVMPRDTGALQNEKTFVDKTNAKNGKVLLISEGPYARRLYYHPEYNFHKEENPDAKGRWLEDWMPGGRKENFVQETFAENLCREMRRQGGGNR